MASLAVGQLFLSLFCGILCVFVGVEADLDALVLVTVVCNHVQKLFSLGEYRVLS